MSSGGEAGDHDVQAGAIVATFPEFSSANQIDPSLAAAIPRGPETDVGVVTSVIPPESMGQASPPGWSGSG